MSENKEYTIVVKRQRVEVSKAVYHAYHQAREAERYQRKCIKDNEYSLERFQEDANTNDSTAAKAGGFNPGEHFD